MGNVKPDESRIRGGNLGGAENPQSAEHVEFEKGRNPDTTLRTDGEEDTLYDDGLELEEDSDPLTGVNGRDDSLRNKS